MSGFGQGVIFTFIMVLLAPPAYSADEENISAKEDYVTCWKQPCVRVAGSEWSEKNPNGVGVSVRMGTKSIVTDDELKTILTNDFKYYDLTKIKFFFEQNDVLATGVVFHIRGGSEGLYRVTEMREQVSKLAKRAKNNNPLFSPSR